MRTNNKMPVRTRACVIALTGALLLGAAPAPSQDAKCLDNNGVFNVDVGVTYKDATGDWVCEPDAEGATAGGWIRVIIPESTPALPATTTAAPTPTPTRERDDDGEHAMPLVILVTLGSVLVAGTIAGIGVAAARRRPRMSGYLHVEEVRRARP